MPTYDFQCNKCQHHFDEILKLDERDQPTTEPCPQCKEENCVEKILAAPALGDPYVLLRNRKIPGDFRERLQEMKRHHRGNKINI